MTKRMFTTIACGLLGAALAPGGTASAAVRSNAWELGLYGTYVSFSTDAFPDNAFGYGGRVGYFITDHQDIELNYAVVPAEDRFGLDEDVDVAGWTLSYQWNWQPNDQVSPYVTAGAGSTNTQVDAFNVDEDDTTGFAGAGLRWFVADDVAVRFEARSISVDSDPSRVSAWDVNIGVGWLVGGR